MGGNQMDGVSLKFKNIPHAYQQLPDSSVIFYLCLSALELYDLLCTLQPLFLLCGSALLTGVETV